MSNNYAQARADHEYLWAIGPANDMTGGYVDQEDLDRLLRNPTKDEARKAYVNQIHYWFEAGPDSNMGLVPWHDERVQEIAERYGIKK